MTRAIPTIALSAVLVLGAAACTYPVSGPDESTDTTVVPGARADVNFDLPWTEATFAVARQAARDLLGVAEEDLPDDVRIGRRGEEHRPLTMDLRFGRLTVGLDDDGSGFRVVDVTLETPDGTEVFELED